MIVMVIVLALMDGNTGIGTCSGGNTGHIANSDMDWQDCNDLLEVSV